MISTYCRKIEKYRCTQMSLKSGYGLRLCHNCISSKNFQFHLLHFSPQHKQKQTSKYTACSTYLLPLGTPEGMFSTSLQKFLQFFLLSYLALRISQLVPPHNPTHKQDGFRGSPGQSFHKFCQISTNIHDRIFLNGNLNLLYENCFLSSLTSYILSKLSQENNPITIGPYIISSKVYGLYFSFIFVFATIISPKIISLWDY